jgi:hypothetical protein
MAYQEWIDGILMAHGVSGLWEARNLSVLVF